MFVHQRGAIGGHAGHEQGFLQTQQVHLGDEFFVGDGVDGEHVAAVHLQLFLGCGDADELGAAGWQV